jgi:DNA invertase Pin-like site-specific DNA recombinase
MQAYIYARFSTLEQAKGSSLERQLADCRAHCERHHWRWSSERELIDEGRSAFDGTNRAEGSSLATFEQDAVDGALPDNTVLVVERLDRLSRQSAVDVFEFVSRLTNHGVAIATVDGDRMYRRGSFDFASLIELIVKAQVAHEESEKKSQRLAAAWAKKRERAASGDRRALTKRCPAWITVDDETGEYLLREDRAVIVRRIFSLATSGQGKHLIARTLNKEGVPAWGRGDGWHASYVQKILRSRATVGELQPHRKVGGKRIAEGEPLLNYYPAVIDEGLFSRAQADRRSRTGMSGRRGKRISNLFAGIAKCGACGSQMTFRNKGSAGEQYLVCDAGLRGRSCDHTVHFHYPSMETAVIEQTLHLALDDRHFAAPAVVRKLEKELAEQSRQLAELEGRKRRLIDVLSRIDDVEVEDQVRQIGSEALAIKASIRNMESDLISARGVTSPKENIARIRRLLASMRSEVEIECAVARGTVQQALRSLIQSITCEPESQLVLVDLGETEFCLDRHGALQSEGSREPSLSRLMDLRERGWVLTKYRNHAALGKRKRKVD